MSASPDEPKQPLWQRVFGVSIGTAIGAVIYGIFLQTLLFQSLILDRKPLDPSEWKEKLSGKAWICGAVYFFSLVFIPLRFLTKGPGSASFIPSESAALWLIICLIFIIQIATVIYAYMRPELNSVEHPVDRFYYFRLSPRAQRFSHRSLAILSEKGERSYALLTTTFDLLNWKNIIQILIICMEFFQLFSMALGDGAVLRGVGVRIFPQSALNFMAALKIAAWQFGMDAASSDPSSYSLGFGLLAGFCGFYIFLCGVFIALDLTVDSPLSPLLFSLLAGGFFGIITSGLLTLIFYSSAASHVIVGSLMLAYYSSTAVFVSIYRSDVKKTARGEIRIIPTFTAVERVLKGVLSAVTVATLAASPLVKAVISFVFCCGFGILLLVVKPYSVLSVSLLRLCFVSISALTSFIVLIASSPYDFYNGSVFSGCLLAGWILIPCIFCISNKISIKCKRRGANPTIVNFENSEIVTNPIHFRIEAVQQASHV